MSNDGQALSPLPDTRFQTLFEQAPFSVQLLAADGRTLRVNKAWEALWQAPGNEGIKDYVLNEYNVLTDPQLEAKGITECLRRAFAGESVVLPAIAYDMSQLGWSGGARWVRAFAHPVRDDGGVVREVMLIHEDVTEQMRTQQALESSERRLQQLANTIPQLAWMADPEGAIHWYNDRWYGFTGTTPQQMEGWGWQSVHDPAVLPQVIAQWQHSLATGEPFQMTFPLRGADGRFRPFFTLVEPLRDAAGKVVQWFGTNTDVSALHDTEQSLRRAEERLRLATDAGSIGIWEWDVARDVVTWSDQVYRLHGVGPGQFGGTVADFSAMVHPDDREPLQREIEKAIAQRAGFSAEFRIVLPDGSPRWLSTWARMTDFTADSPGRMIGATISIDAYKKAEAALRDSDRRKDEFLAMLAHELRNPLAPISTAAHLLQTPGTDAGRIRRASEIIARQVRHITELVDDLLDVSRVTRGLIQLDRSLVDLKSVIDSAVEQSRPAMDARHHAFSVRSGAGEAYVLGDRARLVQVIVNLLDNAAKYSPEGGRVTLTLQVRGDEVEVAVQDQGSGIDAQLLPQVFDLFTQGARNPGRAEGGLGIGMALVKRIVELHGGRVQARSDGAGTGSTFSLMLPRAVDQEIGSAQALPQQASRATGRSLRVMVVDDNLDVADSLGALLECVGHQVLIRHDALGALQGLQEMAPEVFILDIGLPDMDGYELVGRLRERAAPAFYIALTGYGQPQDRARSAAAGFDRHFVKPVDAQSLIDLLDAVP